MSISNTIKASILAGLTLVPQVVQAPGTPKQALYTLSHPMQSSNIELVQNDELYRLMLYPGIQELTREVEQDFNLPKDFLASIVFEESMANPTTINSLRDGGKGLVHIQPPTARAYCARTVPSTGAYTDTLSTTLYEHVFNACNQDLYCTSLIDYRANPRISLMIAARMAVGAREGSFKAVDARPRGASEIPALAANIRKGSQKARTNYQTKIRRWHKLIRKYETSPQLRAKVEREFENRNKHIKFEEFTQQAREFYKQFSGELPSPHCYE